MALPECVALKAHALHDRARFDAYVREAWRFVPGPPIVYRRATRAFTLGERTRCPLHIEQGQKVIVNLAAAQLDERAVYQHPRSFDATRPAGESMLFGHGQHYCIGDRLGFATVSALARALFAGEGMPRQSAEPEQEEQGIVKHVVEFR
jgi:cytochrome P450